MKGFTKEEFTAELVRNLAGAVGGTLATLLIETALPKLSSAITDKVKEIKRRRSMKLDTFETIDADCFEELTTEES